jgi:hypothetical protein
MMSSRVLLTGDRRPSRWSTDQLAFFKPGEI